MIHHKHSGHRMPHEHTSYAALGFVVLVVGIIMAAASPPAKAVQGDINVNASTLTAAPVVVQPAAATGQTTKSPEGSLTFLWPLYGGLVFVLVSFWLGERYAQWFIKRRLNRQGYI
ncbi:MAG TPA: hypothetical protein VLF41_02860 [Candidatus Nanoarchaeia archaeon]|nr:hypothetical protein [Candidatus Nanoarchaeia archaeon]